MSTFDAIHPQPQNVDVQDFQEDSAGTRFLGDKEANGRVILGRFMTKVRMAVAAAYPKADIRVDHEYRVLKEKTYACDEAVVSASLSLQRGPYQEKLLLLGIEYKPKVASALRDQTPFHLSEVFIQAYYVKKSMTHDIWHCLTDMKDFHYFLVGATPEKKHRNTSTFNPTCVIKHPLLSTILSWPKTCLFLSMLLPNELHRTLTIDLLCNRTYET